MNHNTNYIVKTSLIVALGGFLMGFDASVISGVVRFIETEFELSKIQLGWGVSSLTLSATIAMFISGPLSNKFGRKPILYVAAILYAISAIASALAPTFSFLVIARMIGGLGVGASLIIAPMYIAEIAPASVRGKMVSFNQLNIVTGISVAFFTNYLILSLGDSDNVILRDLKIHQYNWRWMLGIEAIPAIVYGIALISVPRSPRWLIMNNQSQEAEKIMTTITGEEQAKNDLKEITESIKADENKSKAKLKDTFKPIYKNVLLIGIVIAILQQITGINSIFFYAPLIFEQAGFGVESSFAQAIFVGLTNLIFTLVAIFLIDKVGRKPLLIIGVSGIAISMALISYSFSTASYKLNASVISEISAEYNTEKLDRMYGIEYSSEIIFKSTIQKLSGDKILDDHGSDLINKSIHVNAGLILISILLFVASFAASLGPVMWVLFSELFPNRIRAIAISFVGFINSVVSFLVQLVFPWELETFGSATTFLIYGIFALIGVAFISYKIPETKGKSLEELQKNLLN